MALPGILIGALAKKVGQSVAEKVVAEVTADPVVKNAMNSEAPWQSRIGVGLGAGGIGALISQVTPVADALGDAVDTVIAPAVVGLNWIGLAVHAPAAGEIGHFIGAVMTLWGLGYAFYGRFFAKGKPPLFSGKG